MGSITVLIGVLLVQIYRCECGLFDYTEIDDPFSFIFNTKEHILNKFGAIGGGSNSDFWNQFSFGNENSLEGRKCTVLSKSDIEPQTGMCTSRENCRKLNGLIEWSSSCSFFKTFCCVKKTCGGQSSSVVSYFQSDSETNGNETCMYNLRIRNNVCQIRLDFKKFTLQPARRRMPNEAFECIDDVFRVVDYPNIPHLCGNNTGQHLYIPVKKLGNRRQKTIQFIVEIENSQQFTEWDIEITQIECPRTSAIRMKRNFLSNPGNEYQLLAPKNCLQYFVAETGTVRSLNLDYKAIGNFIGPMKFTPEYLMLSNEETELNYDTDCDNQDYIAIPEALNIEDNIKFNRICYSLPQNKNISIISTTPGPFYLMFITNDKSGNGSDNETESGFSIHYKRLHNGCD